MSEPMRAHRSFIPSIGAAVSLVAASACAFFIAGAIVAFHGWPRVVQSQAPTQVVVASNAARTAPLVAGRRTARAARVARVRAAARRTPRAAVHGRSLVRRPAGTAPAVTAPRAPTAAPAKTPVPVVRRPPPGTPGVVPSLAKGLSGATSNAGNAVGQTVGRLGGGLAGAVAPVSPQLAKAVAQATAGVATTVSALGGTLAYLLRQAGQQTGQ